MTLIEAFASGRLPAYGVPSVAIYDRLGRVLGHYVDPQAHETIVTIQ